MTVADTAKTHKNLQVKILASDLDSTMIQKTKNGVYKLPPTEVEGHRLLKRYLKREGELEKQALQGEVGNYHVLPSLKEMMSYAQINLIKPLPAGTKAHVVFCRNVIIYFDKQSKIKLFNNLASVIPEGGLVMIGHSESLMGITDCFAPLGKTMYQRNSKPAGGM